MFLVTENKRFLGGWFLLLVLAGRFRVGGIWGGLFLVAWSVLGSGYPNSRFSRVAFSFLSDWRRVENFWRLSL